MVDAGRIRPQDRKANRARIRPAYVQPENVQLLDLTPLRKSRSGFFLDLSQALADAPEHADGVVGLLPIFTARSMGGLVVCRAHLTFNPPINDSQRAGLRACPFLVGCLMSASETWGLTPRELCGFVSFKNVLQTVLLFEFAGTSGM